MLYLSTKIDLIASVIYIQIDYFIILPLSIVSRSIFMRYPFAIDLRGVAVEVVAVGSRVVGRSLYCQSGNGGGGVAIMADAGGS